MMKGQKGITLVALIITIIVMLILVGVSITVALNGGLFDKATDAAEGTNAGALSDNITTILATDATEKYTDASYEALTVEEFTTELQKLVPDATIATVAAADGDTWCSATYKGQTIYVNLTDLAQTPTAPATNP